MVLLLKEWFKKYTLYFTVAHEVIEVDGSTAANRRVVDPDFVNTRCFDSASRLHK